MSTTQRSIDMTGVMPLPPPMNRTLREGKLKQENLPAGPRALSTSPSLTLSHNQFDTRPPGTRLTVSSKQCGRDGLEEIE